MFELQFARRKKVGPSAYHLLSDRKFDTVGVSHVFWQNSLRQRRVVRSDFMYILS